MKKRLALALVLATMLSLVAFPVGAANPTVSITVTAEVVAITNTQSTWAIGTVAVSDTVYFSADGNVDHDYSQIANTGSVAVDVEIQGENIEGGDYDWTLAADGISGSETYGLNASSVNASGTYDIIVKSSDFNDLTTNLAADDIWQWSMLFQAPSAFNAADDGEEKAATITLVASKYVA